MTEGPIAGRPPRKGTRNAEISAQLLAEQLQEQMAAEEFLDDDDHNAVEAPEGGFAYFRTGRTITAKTSASHDVGGRGDQPWFHFGLTETFSEDDDLEAIINGMADITNSATLLMAADMRAKLEALQESRITAPITPRSAR